MRKCLKATNVKLISTRLSCIKSHVCVCVKEREGERDGLRMKLLKLQASVELPNMCKRFPVTKKETILQVIYCPPRRKSKPVSSHRQEEIGLV